MRSISLALITFVALWHTEPVLAQERALEMELSQWQLSSGIERATPRITMPDSASASGAFALSAAGGALGSTVGAFVGLLGGGFAGALVGSTLGSAGGAYGGASIAGEDPSFEKAALGGLAGGAVAIGAMFVLCSVEFCQGPPIFVLPVIQGVGAAIGAVHD